MKTTSLIATLGTALLVSAAGCASSPAKPDAAPSAAAAKPAEGSCGADKKKEGSCGADHKAGAEGPSHGGR